MGKCLKEIDSIFLAIEITDKSFISRYTWDFVQQNKEDERNYQAACSSPLPLDLEGSFEQFSFGSCGSKSCYIQQLLWAIPLSSSKRSLYREDFLKLNQMEIAYGSYGEIAAETSSICSGCQLLFISSNSL
jgi:hypothetical protein